MKITRGRPKTFDHDEVVLLAMNYFWEHGYENTTLDDLLDVMKIKKSSFYSTFKSKEALFLLTLHRYRDQSLEFLSTLSDDIGPRETLLTLVNSSINELQETGSIRGCLIVNTGKECYKAHPSLTVHVSNEHTYFFNAFEQLIIDAKRCNEITNTLSSRVITGRFVNALNGLMVSIQTGAQPDIIEDIKVIIKELLS